MNEIHSPKKQRSPIRYPGGKIRAVPILNEYIPANKNILLSPFLGGGSFELHCANRGMEVFANDLFVPLYTFWSVLQQNPLELRNRIEAILPITKEGFASLRESILTMNDPIDIAVAFYIVNRSSFNGLTFSGGFSTASSNQNLKITDLDVLTDISLEKFKLSNQDCIEFLATHPQTDETFLYADPPYFLTTKLYGRNGGLHKDFNHEGFAKEIQKRSDWLLSYNDCPYIRKLYDDCEIIPVSWKYTMTRKASTEILIRPKTSSINEIL